MRGLLLTLINDILDLSKIEAKQMTLERVEFDPRELVESVVMLFSLQASSKGLEIGYVVESSVPKRIVSDPTRIRQILSNLLGNALKFTSEGYIFVKMAAEKLASNTFKIRCEVTDTGIGIPEDRQTKIFENFTQADSSTSRKYGGTGLGLSISRSLAQLLEGGLEVYSKVDIGSTFTFTGLVTGIEAKNDAEVKSGPLNWVLLEPRELFADAMIQLVGSSPQIASDWKHAFELLRESKGSFTLFVGNGVPCDDIICLSDAISRHPETMHSHIVVATDYEKRKRLQARTVPVVGRLVEVPGRMEAIRSELLRSSAIRSAQGGPTKQPLGAPKLSLKLLVAEDNPVNQKLAQKVLERLGCLVKIAENGEEAVTAHLQEEFDAILMDVQMPVLDGLEATRKIREQSVRPNIPIIALTANALSSDQTECMEAGMNAYIAKPFKPEQIVTALEAYGFRASEVPNET